jgi:hypothetical protein
MRTCRLHELKVYFPIRQTPLLPEKKPDVQSRQDGFVIHIASRRMTGFITWAETAVFELSPSLSDAWKFSSRAAARQAIGRALGPAGAKLNITVVSWSQP